MLVFIFRCAHIYFIIWLNVFGSSKLWRIYSLELTGTIAEYFILTLGALQVEQETKQSETCFVRHPV